MRGRLPDIDLHGNDFGLEYKTVAPKIKMRDKVVKVKDIHNSTEGKMANIALDVRTGAVKGSPLLFRSSLTSDVRTSEK